MSEVVATYVLQLIADSAAAPREARLPFGVLREAEELINDVIDPRFHVQIKEWDEEPRNGESDA